MNPEVKAKWLAALRSGDYTQARYYLRDANNGFCCLGVLCDLHAKETGGQWRRVYGGVYRYDDNSMHLPPVVQEWAELPSHTPSPAPDVYLTDLNDGGKTFAQIADVIEAGL